MSPKTVGAFTDISRKLLLQSSIDVESFVQADLANVIGLAIQAVAINGGGTNEPVGVMATSGIGSVVGGTNGAAPTWGNIVDLETAVAIANADVGTLSYLTNAKVRGKLKKTFVDSGSNAERVWDRSDTPLNGYKAASPTPCPATSPRARPAASARRSCSATSPT
jgi:HK97 family phage major capsid protein